MAGKVRYPRATGRKAPLLHALIDANLDRTQVAAAAGFSTVHLSKIINGRLQVPLEGAQKIASVLKQQVNALFTIDHGPAAPQLPLQKDMAERSHG
jgi:hypothetical protein